MPSSLHRRIGQVGIVGFQGTTVPPELRSLAREFDLAGIILFKRNVESPEQVAELTYELRRLARDVPIWISVDQEGGRVARLRAPFTEWPPMGVLGRSEDEQLAERFARALARELRAVGISLDYAPVLDVHTEPHNPITGYFDGTSWRIDRSLSERVDVVRRLGVAIIRGLQAEGVAACGKHFPGHGDTSADSHLEMPVVEQPPERLRERELLPFKDAIAAGVASIMTSHILFPALDEDRPASISPTIVTDLLREELHFGGMVLTDDLSMKGIAANYTPAQAAVAALTAGSDILLMCDAKVEGHAAMFEALVHAVEDEALRLTRVDDAIARGQRVKARFVSQPGDPLTGTRPLDPSWRPPSAQQLRAVLGCDEHRAIADEMARFL